MKRNARLRQHVAAKAALTVALAGIALLAAACGSTPASTGVANIGSTTTSTTATGTTAASTASPAALGAQLQKFSACMQKHGEPNFPDPEITSNGVSLRIGTGSGIDPKSAPFKKATADCRSFLPTKVGPPKITPAQQADYLKAAACMRAHGIAGFPDPVFPGGSVSFVLPHGMNANSTAFRRARVICEKLIPAGLPYSS